MLACTLFFCICPRWLLVCLAHYKYIALETKVKGHVLMTLSVLKWVWEPFFFFLHSSISVSSEVQGTDECAHHLRLVASSSALPPQYWLTLQSLLCHFSRVCQASAANLLSARALAEIFSPALFRQQTTRYTLTHICWWITLLPASEKPWCFISLPSCEPSPEAHIRIIEVMVTSEWSDSQAAPGKYTIILSTNHKLQSNGSQLKFLSYFNLLYWNLAMLTN